MVASGVIGTVVAGALVAVIGCAIAASALSSVAELTPAGLAYRHNLRRRVIPWASIEGLQVGRAPGVAPWSTLMVERRFDRPVRVASIVGRRRFVEQVIADIDAFRAEQGSASRSG